MLCSAQCQHLSLQKLCQCNLASRIDFDRVGTTSTSSTFNIGVQKSLSTIGVQKSLSTMRPTAVMFSNLKSQFFHETGLESKFTNFENARNSMNPPCRPGCSMLWLDFGSHYNICTIPVSTYPTTELATHFFYVELANFPTSSTIAVSLAVENSTVAEIRHNHGRVNPSRCL